MFSTRWWYICNPEKVTRRKEAKQEGQDGKATAKPLETCLSNNGHEEVKKNTPVVYLRTMEHSFMLALADLSIDTSRMFNVLWYVVKRMEKIEHIQQGGSGGRHVRQHARVN